MEKSILNSLSSGILVTQAQSEKETIIYKNNKFIELFGNIDKIPDILNKKVFEMDDELYVVEKIIEKEKMIYEIIQVKDKSSEIKQLINNLSKEIRSPLHGIAGIVDIMRTADLTAQQHDYMDIIQECSTDLLHLINNVSDYVKIAENKLVLKKKIFDLNEMIDETYNILQSKIKQKDLIVKYNVQSFSQKYIGDSYRIQQILIHILTNAIEYTNKGIVELNVQKKASEPQYDVISIEIKDTGIGIQKQDMQKIFKPFFKTKHSLSNRIGLSLLITKHICQLMNGTIEIVSEYKKGTTVNIIIKLTRNESISDNEFQNKMKDKRVLIIDEDNAERYDLSSFILKNKMKVVATPLITEASTVYLANDYKFDFIIISAKDQKEIEKFRSKIKDCIIIEISDKIDKLNIQRPIEYQTLKMMLYENVKDIQPHHESEILIVEDQISNQIVISKYLNTMGHKKIDIANNGEEAIRKVLSKSKRYDLILMDIMMPIMDGIEATKGIMKIDSKNIIVGITADIIRDVNECVEIGMKDVIIKPVTYKDFKSTCEKFIN